MRDCETDSILWNEYELSNVLPASVGSTKSIIDCTDTSPLYQMGLPSLWKSEYEATAVGYYFYCFDADALTMLESKE